MCVDGRESQDRNASDVAFLLKSIKKTHKNFGKELLRYALIKEYGIIWEFFPTWEGGFPSSENLCYS